MRNLHGNGGSVMEAFLYSKKLKRSFDVVLSIIVLIILSPLIIALWLAVRMMHGSPAIFCQNRPGYRTCPFKIYKFRTMTDRRDANGLLLPDGERLTSLGKFLRRSSLDELPELFNVLKGDMSLVGPRPLLMEYLPFYSAEENRRHDVRPGITGWAQIHGRNHLPWDERLALDVWYVDHRNFLLDLRILWRTCWLVMRSEGVAVDPDTVETNLHEERRCPANRGDKIMAGES